MRNVNSANLTDLVVFICAANIPVMYLDGMLASKVGFDRFQSLYFLATLSVAFGVAIIRSSRIPYWMLAALLGIGISAIGAAFYWGAIVGLVKNVQFIVRGPLLYAVLFLLFVGKVSPAQVRFYAIITMATVSTSTILHYLFSFGLAEKGGRANPILNGFLADTNSAVFSLMFAGLALYHYERSSLMRAVIAIVIFLNLAALDSKSGILLMSAYAATKLYFALGGRSFITRLVYSASLFLLSAAVILFPEVIITQIVQFAYSLSVKGQATLTIRLSSWDFLTIFSATRNLKLAELNQVYPIFTSSFSFLFGRSFALFDTQKFIESDFFDVLFALGFVGLASSLVLYFYPLVHSIKKGATGLALPLLVLLASSTLLVGHTLFSPASVTTISIVSACVLTQAKRHSRKKAVGFHQPDVRLTHA